ncbi:MAG TPA: serine protease [Urbifossiella sp.]|jgi:hypothetical protein|nr:serine protease [Urbifossiella sp.]
MRHLATLALILVAGAAARPADPADAAEAALRATVRLTNGVVSGTGWLVAVPGPDDTVQHVLVTANHVFDGMKSAECRIVYRAPGKGGVFERREERVQIRDGDKTRWVRHPELDVAAVRVAVPPGVDLQPFPYDRVADETWTAKKKVRTGQDVFIPCFPVQRESNPAGWPILRKGSIASHPLTPTAAAKTMLVDYSHFSGDSGAPVVAYPDGEPVVVGLVFAMLRQSNTSVTPFEERTYHVPIDLAVAVQGPFIRQTIDLAVKR